MSLLARPHLRLGSAQSVAVAGLAGSVLLSAASYWVGAVPIYFRERHIPIVSLMPISSIPPRVAFYVGLAILLLAWLRLGALLLDERIGTDWRWMRKVALVWLAPMVLATPLGSRDLWAYAAQGQLVHHGLDPYTSGPSALPGAFAVEVSHRWVSTPAPYGPLWLLLGRIVATVVGNHVTVTVAVLRLFAVAGLLMVAAAVPVIAQRLGHRADVAVWLAVANPLVLLLGVGGGHNDMLMIGLMMIGLRLVSGPVRTWRLLALGSLLITCAIAIKSPAVVALAFAVPLWLPAGIGLAPRRELRRIAAASAVAAGVGVATFAAITAVSGLGLGWVKQINSAAPVVNWMSLPSAAAIGWKLVRGLSNGATHLDAAMREFRTGGTVVTVIALPVLWWLALRSRPWALLALALVVVVVLGPTVQPWYFCWALVVAAVLALSRRSIIWLAGWSLGLVVMIQPSGKGFQMQPQVVPMVLGSLAVAWLILQRRPAPP